MALSYSDWEAFHSARRQQDRMEEKLDQLLLKVEELRMALSQEIVDLSNKIDDATNIIAQELIDLKGQVKNSMSDAEVTAIKTKLQGNIDKLTGLGANPANPVP